MMAGRQLHTPLGEARLLWLFTLLSLALAGWRWRQGAAAPVRATACPPPTQQGGGAGGGARGWPTRGDTIHTLLTSNGSPYTNYQTLALYGSYRRVQRMPGGDKMVAFTRILHRTADDELSRVVPTHRVQPLHPGACCRLALPRCG